MTVSAAGTCARVLLRVCEPCVSMRPVPVCAGHTPERPLNVGAVQAALEELKEQSAGLRDAVRAGFVSVAEVCATPADSIAGGAVLLGRAGQSGSCGGFQRIAPGDRSCYCQTADG